MRFALVGSFDVENYGDLLFPDVFSCYFPDSSIDLFSPNGDCIKPFSENTWVYPIRDLDRKCGEAHYDAIVIGGGDLLRLDTNITVEYRENLSAGESMWITPVLIGHKHHIPIVFNAPGVPFRFKESQKKLISQILKYATYLSVRDGISKERLMECGLKNVEVVPDTNFAIERLFSREMLEERFDMLRQSGSVCVEKKKYFIFQHNCRDVDDTRYIDQLRVSLTGISRETGLQCLLFPIGYIHQDGRFLRKLCTPDSSGNELLYQDGKFDLLDMTAILSQAAGCICTSLHGGVISYAYGVPCVSINLAGYTKVASMCELIGHPEWNLNTITDMKNVFLRAIRQPSVPSREIEEKISMHFAHMREVVLHPLCSDSSMTMDLLRIYLDATDYLKDTPDQTLECANLYLDFGSGFSEENKVQVPYEQDDGKMRIRWDIIPGVKQVRLDPIEGRAISLDFASLFVDEEEIPLEFPLSIIDKGRRDLLTLDPWIMIPCEGKKVLRFTMQAQVMQDEELLDLLRNQQKQGNEIREQLRLTQLDLEKANGRIGVLTDDLKTAGNTIGALKEELSLRNSMSRKRERRMEELEKEQEGMSSKLLDMEQEMADLVQERASLQADLEAANKQLQLYREQIDYLSEDRSSIQQELIVSNEELRLIKNSIGWKVTRPPYMLKDWIFKVTEKTVFTHKLRKAIGILFRHGFGEFWKAFKRFLNVYFGKKEFQAIAQEKDSVLLQANGNNRDGYCPYDAEYQENQDFSQYSTDVKALAFYLPQFHCFPENDQWWGKGFTEWNNVRSGDSRFEGHYQPRVPHEDTGYYCLDDINVMKKQAALAKQHGIYGFCFYYYWFSGKRLMEKPVDMLLEHPEIDLPFCLCWANENWTRAWDGQQKNVLIAQEYSDEDDQIFMRDLKKYIDDARYIRIAGKPLVIVYNPGQIPNCEKTFRTWRKQAKKLGIGEILIWTCQTANNTAASLNICDFIDAEIEFPPHNMWLEPIAVRDVDLHGKSAFIYNYTMLVDYLTERIKCEKTPRVPLHHSCMMAWDNAARRKDAWFTYYAFSLKSLYKWVVAIAEHSRKNFSPEERFIFINAWNEWGEGTYLEPDEKYGYANINTVSKALMSLPLNNDLLVFDEKTPFRTELGRFESSDPKIAIQIHMFYLETLEETIENLNKIPFPFDCYISTDTSKKAELIKSQMLHSCKAHVITVEVFDNRGRDVAPFLVQMESVYQKYDYIGHLHSKKTKTDSHGDDWRSYIFRHLLGSAEHIKHIFDTFEGDSRIGMIMPETYPVLELQAEWGGNQEGVIALMKRMGYNANLPNDPIFPVGNMFWARAAAIRPVMELHLRQEDFPREEGQVNATIAHQIERTWIYAIRENGYDYRKVFNNYEPDSVQFSQKRMCVFVHYDQSNRFSEEDTASIREYAKVFDRLVVVSNSLVSNTQVQRIQSLGSNIAVLRRENTGLDFGAWRHALMEIGREEIASYDELILLNNSVSAPLFSIERVFNAMERKKVDFWGITLFPSLSDGSFLQKEKIEEHIQSYFTAYSQKVVKSDVFWNFWANMPEVNDYMSAVRNCESEFTHLLKDAGFSYDVFIPETRYMSRFLCNYAIPYEKPSSLLILGTPYVKKKCYQHMDSIERIKLENLRKLLGKNTGV